MRYSGYCKNCGSFYELNVIRASMTEPSTGTPHVDSHEAGTRHLTPEEIEERALNEVYIQCPICHLRDITISKDRD